MAGRIMDPFVQWTDPWPVNLEEAASTVDKETNDLFNQLPEHVIRSMIGNQIDTMYLAPVRQDPPSALLPAPQDALSQTPATLSQAPQHAPPKDPRSPPSQALQPVPPVAHQAVLPTSPWAPVHPAPWTPLQQALPPRRILPSPRATVTDQIQLDSGPLSRRIREPTFSNTTICLAPWDADTRVVTSVMGSFPTPPTNFPGPRQNKRQTVRPKFTTSSIPTSTVTSRSNDHPSFGAPQAASSSAPDLSSVFSTFGRGVRGIIHPFHMAVGASPLGVYSTLGVPTSPPASPSSSRSVPPTGVPESASNQSSRSDVTAPNQDSARSPDVPAPALGAAFDNSQLPAVLDDGILSQGLESLQQSPADNANKPQKSGGSQHPNMSTNAVVRGTPQRNAPPPNNADPPNTPVPQNATASHSGLTCMIFRNSYMVVFPHLMTTKSVPFPQSRDLASSGDRCAGVSLVATSTPAVSCRV
jgi:hypothetical protein